MTHSSSYPVCCFWSKCIFLSDNDIPFSRFLLLCVVVVVVVGKMNIPDAPVVLTNLGADAYYVERCRKT